MSDEEHREFLLQAIRAASLRAKLMDAEITAIGISLRCGLVDCVEAVEALHEAGVMPLMLKIPYPIGRPELEVVNVPDIA